MYVFFFLLVTTMGSQGPETRIIESFSKPGQCEQVLQAMGKDREFMQRIKNDQTEVLNVECVPTELNLS